MDDAAGRELRLGVSGHRLLADPRAVAAAVDGVIDEVIDDLADEDDRLVAVSSLAEGADRIVAERVLARGGALEVHLPLAVDDYATDFADAASRVELDTLLAAARSVSVVRTEAGEPREAAYERAGHAVLAGCDVLLALWDGAPARGRGGTAELVADARAAGRPVRVVPVERAS